MRPEKRSLTSVKSPDPAAIAHERVVRFIVMGSVIVVLSVILVTSAKVKEKSVAEELPAVEAAG
jgi:hypothetical protein